MAQNKLHRVNQFLTQLLRLRPLVGMPSSDKLFELFCYFLKVNELINRGKIPVVHNAVGGTFRPHFNPGDPYTASYLSFHDQNPNHVTVNLILNGRFIGKSRVRHSPDIALIEEGSEEITTFYECKQHTRTLGLSIYREFIGYLEEMKIPKRGQKRSRNIFPLLRPCLYTSANAGPNADALQDQYQFTVEDRL